jgi:hypothetical protein
VSDVFAVRDVGLESGFLDGRIVVHAELLWHRTIYERY